MSVINILNELIELFEEEYFNNNNDNPIDNIKEIITGLLTDTFNINKYKYLTIPTDNFFQLSSKTLENINHNKNIESINDEYIETNKIINTKIYSEELFNTDLDYNDYDDKNNDLNTNE
jgi:hypothetical protein